MSLATVDNKSWGERRLSAFTIHSTTSDFDVDILHGVIGNFLTGEGEVPPARQSLTLFPPVQNVRFLDSGGEIEVLLGTAHLNTWVGRPETYVDPKDKFCVIKSKFGWTVAGTIGKYGAPSAPYAGAVIANATVSQDVEKIFLHDFPTITDDQIRHSIDDRKAIAILEKGVRFDEELHRYVAPIPWRGGRDEAAAILNNCDSRSMALRRLFQMKSRFRRDPERKQRIFDAVEKLEASGYVDKKINEKEAPPGCPIWYLPLHVVEKWIEGRGRKTRICHDARAPVNGISPNEQIYGGPNLLNDALGIIIRTRSHRIMFTTDITNFYYRVRVDPKDVNVFRYFWFDDTNCKTFSARRFNSHIFGGKGSSIVTSFILRWHAEKIKHKYPPNVYIVIVKNTYVDDGTGGGDNPEEVRQLVDNLVKAFEEAGMKLDKWKSNDPSIFNGLVNTETKTYGGMEDDDSKVLGVAWKPSKDILTFEYSQEKIKQPVNTARELVSVQAHVYDPAGLISPFILIGRRLLQKATAACKSWDAPLPPEVKKDFAKWQQSIPLLSKIEIPRWWNVPETAASGDESLHAFADAAACGFGICIYRRVVGANGCIHTTLLLGKSHVVPLNPARASHHGSIPRLELTAAAKAVEMANYVNNSLYKPIENVTYWTDSECVLKQIYDTKASYGTFITNRLYKIHALSKPHQWKHVDSGRNPADCPSRGLQADETEKWRFFHEGPEFLRQPEETWPKTNPDIHPPSSSSSSSPFNVDIFAIATSAAEVARVSGSGYADVADRIGDYNRKLKRIACFQKFIAFWKLSATKKRTRSSPTFKQATTIDAEDIKKAEKTLFLAIQKRHFNKEWSILTQNNANSPNSPVNVHTSSKLAPLNPFVDEDGIIRIGSRIANAPINQEKRFPIILPKEDQSVKDLITATHIQEFHRGPNHTLATLRNKVWILRGLQACKSAIHRCFTCQKAFKRAEEQRMAPLPVERVSFNAPFEVTGIDVMGHFNVIMNGRAPQKVWVVIFSCFSTRAVHTEILQKMDASSFINALSRFTARRPGLRKLVSDNGTNFAGACSILRKELEALRDSTTEALAFRRLEWTFIPPHTPHYGGVWERVVGLFKRMISTLGKGDSMRFDVFNTVVIEMEATLNRRPMCALSHSPDDVEALTPAHILYPATFAHSSATIIPQNNVSDADALRSTWKRAQARISACRKLFFREYVTILHQRQKWQRSKASLKVDDIVILVDESIPRDNWKIARVTHVESSDGLVRRVKVKRSDGRISTHDRTKIVKLEIE